MMDMYSKTRNIGAGLSDSPRLCGFLIECTGLFRGELS